MTGEEKPDMGEVIQNILQAEAKAEEIALAAKAQAKEALSRAQTDAARIKAEGEERAKDALRKVRADAERVAFERSMAARKECEGRKKQLTALAEQNTPEAVKIILEQLSARYDR